MKISVRFALEGIGGQVAEVDVTVEETTRNGVSVYTLVYKGTPEEAGLTSGLYAIAAVVTVEPGESACAQGVLGYGYIAERLLQVYPVA